MDIRRILAELRKEQRNLNQAIAALEKLQLEQEAPKKIVRRQARERVRVRSSRKAGKAVGPADKHCRPAQIILFPKPIRRAPSRKPVIMDSRR